MFETKKGTYGYLQRQRKWEIIKTIVFFGISLSIFLMGYLLAGTKANLLTIVAVLGCLPASKSAVSMIMYLKACKCTCTQECKAAVEKCTEGSQASGSLLYDLYLTSEKKNFQISAAIIKNHVICGLSQDTDCDLRAGEKHIQGILEQNGHTGYTVKLFSDMGKFTDRLEELWKMEEKNVSRDVEISELLMQISL